MWKHCCAAGWILSETVSLTGSNWNSLCWVWTQTHSSGNITTAYNNTQIDLYRIRRKGWVINSLVVINKSTGELRTKWEVLTLGLFFNHWFTHVFPCLDFCLVFSWVFQHLAWTHCEFCTSGCIWSTERSNIFTLTRFHPQRGTVYYLTSLPHSIFLLYTFVWDHFVRKRWREAILQSGKLWRDNDRRK